MFLSTTQILLFPTAKLMTFNDLRTLVRTEDGPLNEVSLLSALSAAACCVKGLWTARSTELYTRASAVPLKLLAAARDHVVSWKFRYIYVTIL